jgi:hypothetical protein
MSLDPPDEWWWYVANDNRGQPNPFVQTRPIAYRFHWTRLRLRSSPFIGIAQILHWLYETAHRNGGLGSSRRDSALLPLTRRN